MWSDKWEVKFHPLRIDEQNLGWSVVRLTGYPRFDEIIGIFRVVGGSCRVITGF